MSYDRYKIGKLFLLDTIDFSILSTSHMQCVIYIAFESITLEIVRWLSG